MTALPDPRDLGSLGQVAGVDEFTLAAGPGAGSRVWRVRTGGRLTADILCDRAFDLGRVEVAGVPVAWWSPVGFVRGGSRSPGAMDWLDHFSGGLLTTCGLQAVGSPSRHGDVDWPLHGAITHMAAEKTSWAADEVADAPALVCRGEVREAGSLGPNLVLQRTLTFPLGEAAIRLDDAVVNAGWETTAIQLLYHVNLGWPLVGDSAAWKDTGERVPSVEAVSAVAPGSSRIYRHELMPADGVIAVAVEAETSAGLVRVSLSYDPHQLPALWQWVDRRPGRNVVGLEPAFGAVLGRAAAAEEGLLLDLEPGEAHRAGLTLTFGVASR
jgi:hypothetical protein